MAASPPRLTPVEASQQGQTHRKLAARPARGPPLLVSTTAAGAATGTAAPPPPPPPPLPLPVRSAYFGREADGGGRGRELISVLPAAIPPKAPYRPHLEYLQCLVFCRLVILRARSHL